MAKRYHVYAQSLSAAQFDELLSNLDGATFMVNLIASQNNALDVFLHENQTMEPLNEAFPLLKGCRCVLIT
jgi:hypothetical protein